MTGGEGGSWEARWGAAAVVHVCVAGNGCSSKGLLGTALSKHNEEPSETQDTA